MLVLVFDPFHGAAGDMIVGALLDCGANRKSVVQAMQSVIAEPVITEVTRAGIGALKVNTQADPTHRTLADGMKRLDDAAAGIPPEALAMAKRVFTRIKDAEELVHGSHAHFHEVGADDAIADVIGACTAYHSLGIEAATIMPVTLGRGSAAGSHGTFPIPAPATAVILSRAGLAVRQGNEEVELCTPTGAALLAEFSTIALPDLGSYSIKAIGYGAGTRDPIDVPNVIRAMVIETTGENMPLRPDMVDILETNIDDVGGEVIAHTITRLMEKGARDACAIPILMKKGRPGFLIRNPGLPFFMSIGIAHASRAPFSINLVIVWAITSPPTSSIFVSRISTMSGRSGIFSPVVSMTIARITFGTSIGSRVPAPYPIALME